MSFDWQTEEAVDWEDLAQIPEEPETPKKGKSHRFIFVGIFVILAFVSGFVAYRLLAQRVDDGATQVESDLMASYAVVERAADAGDTELFASFLSGKDKAWAADYEQIVANGRYRDRSAFDLTWLPVADPVTAVISTTLNPEFTAAEVLAEHTYRIPIGNGLTQTVRLQHTAVYRLGADRWLLAPPEPDFWGDMLTEEGYYLTLNYPERDDDLARRLARDLDTKLVELCHLVDFECDENFHIEIDLVTSVAALVPPFSSVPEGDNGIRLEFPTPSLIGVPQDDAGYEALARGYMDGVIGLTTLSFLEGECCRVGLFAPAIVEFQLVRMGVRSSPLTAVDWENLAQSGVTIAEGEQSWQSSEESQLIAYAIIDFLLNELRVPLNSLIKSMPVERPGFTLWLQDMVGSRYSEAELEEMWQRYVQEKSTQEFPSTAATP